MRKKGRLAITTVSRNKVKKKLVKNLKKKRKNIKMIRNQAPKIQMKSEICSEKKVMMILLRRRNQLKNLKEMKQPKIATLLTFIGEILMKTDVAKDGLTLV